MSSFACYWPWLLGGALLGWLLWQLFDKMFRRDGEAAGVRVSRDLDTAKSQVSSLHADLNGANTRLSSLSAELATGAASLKAKTDEAMHVRGELTEWMNKHAELESHGKAAVAAVTAAAATAAALATAQLKAAHDKHVALQAELDGASRSLNMKTEEHARFSAELGEWKTRHAATDTHAKATAAELADARAKHATIDSHHRATAAELADWKTRHATTDSQLHALSGELSEWKATHANLDTKYKAHLSELSEWKERHATVDSHAKSTAAQLATTDLLCLQ